MQSQIAHPYSHNQEHGVSNVTHQHVEEGENEHDHEKNSVVKKVKAKAKKIKDTIKKHGHGHNHDHDQGQDYHLKDVPDDHDLDEEDDEEDEMVEDQEIHGAPMYHSAAVRGSDVLGLPEVLSGPGITNERSRAVHEHTLGVSRPEAFSSENYQTKGNDAVKSSRPAQDAVGPRLILGKGKPVMDEEPLAPKNTPVPIYGHHQTEDADHTKTLDHGREEYPGQPKVNLERPRGLEEDLAAPKATPDAYPKTNYETKVTDPTGKGEEVTGITPVLHSLDKMKIYDEQNTGPEQNFRSGTHNLSPSLHFSTGSHDQFSPEASAPKSVLNPENPQQVSETTNVRKFHEQPSEVISDGDRPSNQSSYTDKSSSATSAIADKASSAKNAVASKLGYEEKDKKAGTEMREGEDELQEHPHEGRTPDKPTNQSSYSEKISSATSAIAGKAESAKNILASKLGYGEGDNKNEVEDEAQESPHDGNQELNQSSYSDKSSSGTSAIADKAISAKNVVASKIGYGEKEKKPDHELPESGSTAQAAQQTSAADYGKKIAATVTEKLTPVYEKVAGAGTAVMSKVQGPNTGGTASEQETGAIEQDKGVSMKDYVAEKLKPGEEDKALSQVISDAWHSRKEKPEKENRPRVKVTESEEVEGRLGTWDEKGEERVRSSIVNSPGKGVVDKLKDAVTSWFTKDEETQESSSHPGTERSSNSPSSGSQDVKQISDRVGGDRRLQESGN